VASLKPVRPLVLALLGLAACRPALPDPDALRRLDHARAARRRLFRLRRQPDSVALSEWRRLLRDEQARVRRGAVEALAAAAARGNDAAPLLLPLLVDPVDEVRCAAALALGRLARRGRADPLPIAELLRDPSPNLRQTAVRALDSIDAPVLVGRVATLAADRNLPNPARSAAIRVLARSRARPAFNGLTALLGEPDDSIRTAAIRALPAFGESLALRPLTGAVAGARAATRRAAATALGRLGSRRATRHLLGLLDDPDWPVVRAAVAALGLIRDTLAVRPLANLLRRRPDAAAVPVRIALVRIGPTAALPVSGLLLREDNELRCAALTILGALGGDSARAALVRSLPDWHCGPAAARSLERLHWLPRNSIDAIRYHVARRDVGALIEFGPELHAVLRADAGAESRRTVENAVFTMIALGAAPMINDLITVIEQKGTRTLAEAYINSGCPPLVSAGREWAERHDYFLVQGPGRTGHWGGWIARTPGP
jgi:HEAT repeat protein